MITRLQPADATLAIDLIERMSQLRENDYPFEYRMPLLQEPSADRLKELGEQVLFERLRQEWVEVEYLPPCTRQCRILSEVATAGTWGHLTLDPISGHGLALTFEVSRGHAERALEIAERLGDRIEQARALFPLGSILFRALNDYPEAAKTLRRMRSLADEIGSLDLAERAAGAYEELLSMEVIAGDRLAAQEDVANLAGKCGMPLREFGVRCHLALHRLARGQRDETTTQLKQIESLRETLLNSPGSDYLERHYWNVQSRMASSAQLPDVAIKAQRAAIEANLSSDTPQDAHLWDDLARLEHLYLETGQEKEFRYFCDKMEFEKSSRLQQAYLTPSDPPSPLPSAPASMWRYQGTGNFVFDEDGTSILHPIPGTGFASAVLVGRRSLEVVGDFSVEIDLQRGTERWAGGLFLRQSDQRLVRFAVGIQADSEVTLSTKTEDVGLVIVARGCVNQADITLRLERRGDRISTYVSADERWWSFRPMDFALSNPAELGVYAESSYEAFAERRCQNHPVVCSAIRFTSAL